MSTRPADTKAADVASEVECQREDVDVDDPQKFESSEFNFTPEEEKKILRRVDHRLVITIGAMYCISLVDRVNMGAANLAGMGKELSLTGFRYVCFI